MALTTITAALTQYNENALWHESSVKALLALEALRFLLVNRAQQSGHAGTNLNYEALAEEVKKIEGYLGVTRSVNSGGQKSGLYKFRKV